jgi:hypothetical protein
MLSAMRTPISIFHFNPRLKMTQWYETPRCVEPESAAHIPVKGLRMVLGDQALPHLNCMSA